MSYQFKETRVIRYNNVYTIVVIYPKYLHGVFVVFFLLFLLTLLVQPNTVCGVYIFYSNSVVHCQLFWCLFPLCLSIYPYVCYNVQGTAKSFEVGETSVWASNSFDPDAMFSYSTSHLNQSYFHVVLWWCLVGQGLKRVQEVGQGSIKKCTLDLSV